MTTSEDTGSRVFASVSRWPAGTDIPAAEAREQRLLQTLGALAPDADELTIRVAAFEVGLGVARHRDTPSLAEATGQIDRLKRALIELREAMDSISKQAFEAIDLETEALLGSVGGRASKLHRRSKQDGPHKDRTDADRLRSLRSRKPAARSVTLDAMKVYRRLSGLRPTWTTPTDGGKAHGPFLDYLGEMFAALAIEASPESQARAVIDWFDAWEAFEAMEIGEAQTNE